MANVSADDRIINIFPNNVHVFTQSTSLGWGCSGGPKGWIIQAFFSSFNLQLSFFTAPTKSNPKVMTGMNCWTGAGTEAARGAAPGSRELSDPPQQQERGSSG